MHLLELSKRMQLHSETILGYILELKKIRVIRVPFYFQRIRINGTPSPGDVGLKNGKQ